MRPADWTEAARIDSALTSYEQSHGQLVGLRGANRGVFIEQLVDSQRRTRYLKLLASRDFPPGVADPANSGFDPLMAAVLKRNQGALDDACWLVFLSVHFGRHRVSGWKYTRDVYGGLGRATWDWTHAASDIAGFKAWLDANYSTLRSGATSHGFGNHRKYESLRAYTEAGTGRVAESYVSWILDAGSHRQRLLVNANMAAEERFSECFRSMNAVARFGRTARFDYLTTLGKLRLADITADSARLTGATGPLRGARLLFEGRTQGLTLAGSLEQELSNLNVVLQLRFDDLEDALCNWQKSPVRHVPFRG